MKITVQIATKLIILSLFVIPACGDAGSESDDDSYAIRGRGPAGGWIFYDKGSYSDGWRYLEAAPIDQTLRSWGFGYSVVGADGTAIGTGKQNTLDIIAGDAQPNKAADECANYSIVNGGVTYDDWFLPSLDELNQMYENLHMYGVGDFVDDEYWS